MECPFNSAKSSSRPNGVLSIAGFRIFVHRPRACFPVRPGRCVISSDHRVYGAASAGSARTVRITIESSSAVHVRLGLGLGAEAEGGGDGVAATAAGAAASMMVLVFPWGEGGSLDMILCGANSEKRGRDKNDTRGCP